MVTQVRVRVFPALDLLSVCCHLHMTGNSLLIGYSRCRYFRQCQGSPPMQQTKVITSLQFKQGDQEGILSSATANGLYDQG